MPTYKYLSGFLIFLTQALFACSLSTVKILKEYTKNDFYGKSFSFFPIGNSQIISVSNLGDSLTHVLTRDLGRHVEGAKFLPPFGGHSLPTEVELETKHFDAGKKPGFSIRIPTKMFLESNNASVSYLLILDSIFISIDRVEVLQSGNYFSRLDPGSSVTLSREKLWFNFVIWDYELNRAVSYGQRITYVGTPHYSASSFGKWETVFKHLSYVALQGTPMFKRETSKINSYWYLEQ